MDIERSGIGCEIACVYDCTDYGSGWIGGEDQDLEDEFQAIEGEA